MKGPAIQPDIDVMTVYDEEKMGGRDRSGYLHVKLLFAHFPETVTVKNLIIFDRSKSGVSHAFHYAIVYTDGMQHTDGNELTLPFLSQKSSKTVFTTFGIICEPLGANTMTTGAMKSTSTASTGSLTKTSNSVPHWQTCHRL